MGRLHRGGIREPMIFGFWRFRGVHGSGCRINVETKA